jgi:hypothetical protein
VWLYTGGNGWFSRDEQALRHDRSRSGSPSGRPQRRRLRPEGRPDEAIRRVHSVLTLLGGRIVHGDAAALSRLPQRQGVNQAPLSLVFTRLTAIYTGLT